MSKFYPSILNLGNLCTTAEPTTNNVKINIAHTQLKPVTENVLVNAKLSYACCDETTFTGLVLVISVGITGGGGVFDPLVHVFNPLFCHFCDLC